MRLRAKITLSLLLLATVPLCIVTFLLAQLKYDRLIDDARHYRKAVAEHATVNVRELLRGSVRELSSLGNILTDPALDPQEQMKQAGVWISGTDFVRVVAVYNPKGQRLVTFRQKRSRAQKPPDALEARDMKQAIDEGSEFSSVQYDHKKAPFLSLIYPIYKRGAGKKKPHAFLWSTLGLSSLSERVTNLSVRRFNKRPDQVFLLDSKQRILAHSNRGFWGTSARSILPGAPALDTKKAKQIALTYDFKLRGEEFAASLVPIQGLGWRVVVRQSKAFAYADVYQTILVSAIVGLVFLALAMIFGLWLGGRLAAPILEVSDAAKQVASGDFSTRIAVSSRDEVGEMAQSFNAMATDLESYEEQLIEETRIRQDLGRYLNADLVENIVSQKEELKLGGERKVITVLFADIVAFTPLTEKHEPERVVAILNELFTFLTEIIFKHGGIIDKFIGDCVMAVFGAPHGHEDDPLHAARAADEMMRWLEVGNARWKKELGMELQMGIGMNTGEAIVGNIGSSKRMEYTVIGDTVNIAARLETLARPGQILLTEAMVPIVEEEYDCESLGTHQLVGKEAPIEIFVLVD